MQKENEQPLALLRAEGISKIYSGGALAVGLHRFTASFYRGEFVAVTGSSGSGKSTLLNLLSGLDSYDEGELYFEGEPTSHFTEEDRANYRKDHVSFIFQDYNILDSYTVFQNIELALLYSFPDPKARKARIQELIQAVGLTGHEKQRCSKLSGGQKQRVSIARALAKDAPILFADEPCGNLDSTMSAEIMQLLHDVSKEKLVIMVTHSYDEVAPYVTRKIRLADGELVEDQVFREVALPFEEIKPPAIKKSEVLRGLFLVASNNVKATPKRSVFGIFGLTILTAIFIIGMVVSMSVVELGYFNNGAFRYDLQVCKRIGAFDSSTAATTISAEEIAEIEAIDGVVGVYRDNEAINEYIFANFRSLDYGIGYYARPITGMDVSLYQGRLPENENEIVIGMPASRPVLSKVNVGETIEVGNYYYGAGESETYTVVGITLDSEECAFLLDSYFRHAENMTSDADRQLIVTVGPKANMDKVRDQLYDKGYLVLHNYGDYPYQNTRQLVNFSMVIGLLIGMFLLFRVITGSYRALERSKRVDYNIMRTVGLPSRFVKSIYYVEMLLQGLIGWLGGLVFALAAGIAYGAGVTPDFAYGLRMVGNMAPNLAWIIVVALFADIVVTIGNAYRFNRYFYRQTVKKSLKEAQHD